MEKQKMTKKQFKWWSISVLFCMCLYTFQIFYGHVSKFNIVCAYLTNSLFMGIIWFNQYLFMDYKEVQERLDKLMDTEVNYLRDQVVRLITEKVNNGIAENKS